MQISTLTSIVGSAAAPGARLASPEQGTVTAKVSAHETFRTALSASSLTRISSLSAPATSGIDSDALNSMLQTSLAMRTIRDDSSLSSDDKKAYLAILAKANKEALAVANAKSEQHAMSTFIEDASENAQAIREEGQEIADAAAQEAASGESTTAPEVLDASTQAYPPGPESELGAPAYPDSDSETVVTGQRVDIHA